jgi:hyperosmotically inducible periplasmic protein
MKNITFAVLSALLSVSAIACSDVAKTSSTAPNATDAPVSSVAQPTAQTNQDDATSEMRRKQLNSDVRAREQRNDVAGDQSVKADGDLESEVRSKLEANLPASSLAIDAKDGVVTVTGSVVNQEQLEKIETLAKEIKGVKSVIIKAAIAVETPKAPQPESSVPMKQ